MWLSLESKPWKWETAPLQTTDTCSSANRLAFLSSVSQSQRGGGGERRERGEEREGRGERGERGGGDDALTLSSSLKSYILCWTKSSSPAFPPGLIRRLSYKMACLQKNHRVLGTLAGIGFRLQFG